MFANQILKETLIAFWKQFGGKKTNGVGFDPQSKLAALVELRDFVVPFYKQQSLAKRRSHFNDIKSKLHSFSRFSPCFVCGIGATARHHIVQLKNGGINSKKNIVSLCHQCHSTIHPWLKEG
jgi:hypothetical protein